MDLKIISRFFHRMWRWMGNDLVKWSSTGCLRDSDQIIQAGLYRFTKRIISSNTLPLYIPNHYITYLSQVKIP